MQVVAMTDVGIVRQSNQDYFIVEDQQVGAFKNLFLIADGVGSNIKSGYASKHTCDFVYDQLKKTTFGIDYVKEFERAYRMANTDLFYRILANKNYAGMGTTLIMSTIDNDRLIIGNIGDSRCYHIRDKIVQVTRDHSVAEELVRTNSLDRNSEMYKMYKHQLTKAIGAKKTIVPDFFERELEIGDYILFCTDGITNMLSDKKIFEIIKQKTDLKTKITNLIDMSNQNGGTDNMAAILIYIDYIDKAESIFEQEKQMNEEHNEKKLIDLVEENEEQIIKRERIKDLKNSNMSNLMVDVNKYDENENIKIYNLGRGRSRKKRFDNDDIDINNNRKEANHNGE